MHTCSMLPVTHDSQPDEGDGKSGLDRDTNSVQVLLSKSIRAHSKSTDDLPAEKKHDFWKTVMCSPEVVSCETQTPARMQADAVKLPHTVGPTTVPARSPLPYYNFPKLPPVGLKPTVTSKFAHHEKRRKQLVPLQKSILESVRVKGDHDHDKPFPCLQCGLRFKKRCNAINHTKIVHDKERPFTCSYCSKPFGKKSNCQKHEKLHVNFSHKYNPRSASTSK